MTEYNDKYLIFITTSYYRYDQNYERSIYPIVYLKLSSKKVKTPQDIDDAEFIIINEVPWSWRYLPYSGLIDDDELRKERDKTKLYPNDYYFLTEYQLKIFPDKNNKEFIKDCDYIRHPDFKKPEGEYFHWQDGLVNHFQGYVLPLPWFFDQMIGNYRRYNLRKSVFYQLPKEEMVKHKDSLTPIYQKYYKSFMENYNEDEH